MLRPTGRRDVNSSKWDPSCTLQLEAPCYKTTADAVPAYFEVLPVVPIDLTVDYTPSNWTRFGEELAAAEFLEEGAGLSEALPGESSLAAPAAPLARRRKLSSDIGFAVAFSEADPESMYAPATMSLPQTVPAAVIDTDIINNPDATISWVPLNVSASPCLMAMNSELPVDFLMVSPCTTWHLLVQAKLKLALVIFCRGTWTVRCWIALAEPTHHPCRLSLLPPHDRLPRPEVPRARRSPPRLRRPPPPRAPLPAA